MRYKITVEVLPEDLHEPRELNGRLKCSMEITEELLKYADLQKPEVFTFEQLWAQVQKYLGKDEPVPEPYVPKTDPSKPLYAPPYNPTCGTPLTPKEHYEELMKDQTYCPVCGYDEKQGFTYKKMLDYEQRR